MKLIKKVINYELIDRRYMITEYIQHVAVKRRVSVQRIRNEIAEQMQILPSLLSMLEKSESGKPGTNLTIEVEDRLNAYFSRELEKEISLTGNTQLALA